MKKWIYRHSEETVSTFYFFDSEVLYCIFDNILDFLEKVHGTPNDLLKSVLTDLREPFLKAGLKALGLISKLVTGPLWRIVEQKGTHILSLNHYYKDLQTFLINSSHDSSNFMKGEYIPFPSEFVKKDKRYEQLLKPSESEEIVQQILQFLFTAISHKVNDMLKDQLPGGKYFEITPEIQRGAASVIPHNKFSERVFGLLDHLVKHRPNAKTITNEALIMFSHNKTSQWLAKQSPEVREKLLINARALGLETREKFKEICEQILNKRKQMLQEKQQKIAQKGAKDYETKEHLTNNIIKYGLWQTHETMQDYLHNVLETKSEKLEAIKSQFRFRKQIPSDKKLYNFSDKQTGIYSIDKLKKNLATLINEAKEKQTDHDHIIVGKRVKHKFKVDGEEKWFPGIVISTVPGFNLWYNIKYDEDASIYTYRLEEDYAAGNLELIVCFANVRLLVGLKIA